MRAPRVAALVVSFGLRAGHRAGNCRALAPARRWVGGLPAVAALPLFLVPEICSRAGTLASAWLLLQGDLWRALAVYVATKLLAGMTALWIYTACLPALMQIRAFAAVHDALGAMRRAMVCAIRARLRGVPNAPTAPP